MLSAVGLEGSYVVGIRYVTSNFCTLDGIYKAGRKVVENGGRVAKCWKILTDPGDSRHLLLWSPPVLLLQL